MGVLAEATETALIVPVPAAEAVVGPYRAILDDSAPLGVPAHVTVLSPFLPPERVTEQVLGDLRACLTAVPSFGCVFARVAWFGTQVVWLAPEPDAPFRALTGSVWHRFPECPPYGGAYPDAIPHLTVGTAHRAEPAAMRRAAVEVRARLPIRALVDRVRLIAGTGAPGSWGTVAEFALPSA
ncbi:2'-5' RNA ligase superfamily protein [Murinocardiopsis flavida]|uniref:2'-5' RNA ligase superfamily protein n=2 Tax=Murinocardiopsis flavida TaxID=645275 RepID=A0A2P8DFM1_9ACTN|nr:2'-5' RNA ligase superfamily protein [Murinocardiopsis flavida]